MTDQGDAMLESLLQRVMTPQGTPEDLRQALDHLAALPPTDDLATGIRRRLLLSLTLMLRGMRFPRAAEPDDLRRGLAISQQVIAETEADPALAGDPRVARLLAAARMTAAMITVITSLPSEVITGITGAVWSGTPVELSRIQVPETPVADAATPLRELLRPFDPQTVPELASELSALSLTADLLQAGQDDDPEQFLDVVRRFDTIGFGELPMNPATDALVQRMAVGRAVIARPHLSDPQERRRTTAALEAALALASGGDDTRIDLLTALGRAHLAGITDDTDPGAAKAAWEAFTAVLDLTPPGHPRRAEALSGVGIVGALAHAGLGTGRPEAGLIAAREALDEAVTLLGDDLDDSDALTVMSQTYTRLFESLISGASNDLDPQIERLADLAGRYGPQSPSGRSLGTLLKLVIDHRARMRNDFNERDFAKRLPWLGLYGDSDTVLPGLGRVSDLIQFQQILAQVQGMAGDPAGHLPDLEVAAGQLGRIADELPEKSLLSGMVGQFLGTIQLLIGLATGETSRTRGALLTVITAAEQADPRLSMFWPMTAMAGLLVAGVMTTGNSPGTPEETERWLDDAIGMLRRAVAAQPAGTSEEGVSGFDTRVRLGRALLDRHLHRCRGPDSPTATMADLDEAIGLLRPAVEHVAGVVNWQSSAQTGMDLARALRAKGRHCDDPGPWNAEAVASATRALRLFGRGVLLQTGTGAGLEAAQDVAQQSLTLTRWCLADGDLGGAVTALEAGRGLVLAAATAGDEVVRLLSRAGRPDLLELWSSPAAGPPLSVPSLDEPGLTQVLSAVGTGAGQLTLRHQVLTAIDAVAPVGWWSRTVSAGEIPAVLKDLGVDALAYLIPGDERDPGAVVVVRADGEMMHWPAPDLHLATGSTAERFAAATSADGETRRIAELLPEVSAWAWSAATGPLLERMSEPDPRVVLVPVGALALIPWHAARSPAGEYACQRAVISCAASARQLADAGHRPARPLNNGVLLLANPGGGLRWAARSASAVKREIRSGAEVFGRMVEDGTSPVRSVPASAETVASAFDRAALFELAGHAVSGETPAQTRIQVDQDEWLTLSEILEAARQRSLGDSGGLVLLSACQSALTVAYHDEALTLASGLLSGPARAVIGTRWPVNDRVAGIFTYLLHRNLAAGESGLTDPARALTATQRWFLDPNRVLPESAFLRRALTSPILLDHPITVATWAAFAAYGC